MLLTRPAFSQSFSQSFSKGFSRAFSLLLLPSTLAIFCLAVGPAASQADSPVTSSTFHEVYADIGPVAEAAETHELDPEMARYLLQSTAPLDHIAAVANALSWNLSGRDHAARYAAELVKERPRLRRRVRRGKRLPGRISFTLGYLEAMDDYFAVDDAERLLRRARKKLPESFTVAAVHAIVRGQQLFDDVDRWCEIWTTFEAVLQDFPDAERDLRPAAVASITDYLILYRESCDHEDEGEP